jgi:hypothetical protein
MSGGIGSAFAAGWGYRVTARSGGLRGHNCRPPSPVLGVMGQVPGVVLGCRAARDRSKITASTARPARRYQRQQRAGLAVSVWGGTVVSTWVT